MDVLEAITTRRSIRKYVQRPVEFEKITTIIDAGRHAPSAGSLQQWRFIIVTDKTLIKEVSSYSIEQYWIETAPALIIACALPERYESYYGLRGKRLYAIQDCAAAIQNMLLTATNLGLGTCWVGAFEEDKLRALFSIPSDVRPQAIISIGYADETPPAREFIPLENVTYFNRYGGRVEKLHIVLRDYSVEWQHQGRYLRGRMSNNFRRLKEEVNKIGSRFKEHLQKKKEKK